MQEEQEGRSKGSIMAKKFMFRGKSLEELQKMSIKDFSKLVKSRARRKLERLDEKDKAFIKKVNETQGDKLIKTHLRDMVVLPSFVGKKIGIYNGKEFVAVNILPEMIGHRLGEFSQTRKDVKHSGAGIGATRSSKNVARK